MNDYRQVNFILSPYNETESDILSALLCDEGFETFVPNTDGLSAYISNQLYTHSMINRVIERYPFNSKIEWNETFIEGQNWNEEWEQNYFSPIIIDDKCCIHATFHHDYPSVKYDIVIDPKMAFGTGHHETTTLMVKNILATDVSAMKIIDMGTGTGILAFLCEKKGASEINGIEIDEMAYNNALQNITLNNSEKIKIHHGDATLLATITKHQKADMLLANINRNIILADIETYIASLRPGGLLQLSGFYESDNQEVETKCNSIGMKKIKQDTLNNWSMLLFIKEE